MTIKPFTVDGNIVVNEATITNDGTSIILPSSSTIDGGGNVLDATNSTTDDLTEGVTNLYFTDARADARIALQVGANLDLSSKSTTDLSEGTNLYYTQGRFDTAFTAKSTTDLSEGTNLYYTDTRADARIALQAGANLDLSSKSTTDLAEGTNLYYTDTRADARIAAASITDLSDADQSVQTTDNVTFANITATGYIAGPATFTIDPAAVGDATGTVVILGDLQVDGTTTTINSTTLDVDDLNITVASGAANAAAADGAGLTVDGASATLTYDSANDRWAMNKSLDVTGTVTADGLNVSGTNDVALIITNQSNYTEGLTIRNTANWGYGSSVSFESKTSDGGSNAEVGRIQSTWNAAGYHGLDFYALNNNTLLRHMRLDGYGDFSLYDDTGVNAKFFWDASAERLGLGTTSPNDKLHIEHSDTGTYSASSLGTGMQVARKNSSNTNNQAVTLSLVATGWEGITTGLAGISAVQPSNTSSADLVFQNRSGGGYQENMRIKFDGKVGIGTDSPDTILEIVSSNPILTLRDTGTGFNNGDATLRLAESGAGDTLGGYFDVRLDASMLKFDFTPEGGSVSTYMAINSSDGNVGIGHTSPDEVLDVKGNFTLRDTTGNLAHGMSVFGDDDQYAIFNQESSGDGGLRITTLSDAVSASSAFQVNAVATTVSTDGNAAAIRLRSAKKNGTTEQALADNEDVLSIGNTGTELVIVKGNGNVGIGTTSPGTKLHVTRSTSDTSGRTIYADGTQLSAISTNGTNYLHNVWIENRNFDIDSGITDSGYRIGLNIEGYHDSSVFEGTLDTQKNIWSRNGNNVNGTGTITNSYNLHLETLSGGGITITNNYGLYQSGAGTKNYFEGNVGIGDNAPAGKLEVQNTSVNYAILGTSNKGHYFESQSDDNTDAFEIYQQHGSNTTRNSFVVNDNRTGSKSAALVVRGDGNVGIGVASPSYTLDVDVGAPSSTDKTIARFSSQAGIRDIGFVWDDSASTMGIATLTNHAMTFHINGNSNEKMRIDNSGNLLFEHTNFASGWGTTNRAAIAVGANYKFWSSRNSTTSRGHMIFYNPNGAVGSITTDGSSTLFNTSSDYRLKENLADISDGITRVKQLEPKRFNFIADPDKTVDGFLAHEAQAVVPEAVTGTHNEVDDDGNAVMQGIDQAKLVPLLTAALKESIDKIEALEARVTALES